MAVGGMSNTFLKEAVKLLQKAAKNEQVQAAAVEPIAKGVAWTGKKAGKAGTKIGDVGTRPARAYRHRRMARAHAFQVQGQYSRKTMVLGRRRNIVWKDGEAVACYPPLTAQELNGKILNELPELQDFNPELLIDPKETP